MASQRQIDSNRRNSERSTGPRSESGRSRSRLNATKHGLASRLPEVEAGFSPEFEDRRAKWAAEQNPIGQAGHFALDRAVAATFRIERCEREVDRICVVDRERAGLAWDEDRAVEAANVAARLPRDPVVASRKLQTSLAGVVLLIGAWLGLVENLENEDWSESEESKALDLFGVDPELRSGKTRIDAPEGSDPIHFRRELALDEVDRLEAIHDEAMVPLDELDQKHAMAGDAALHSKRAALLLRYERDAWKRFNKAMKELKDPADVASAPPPPIPAPTPRPIAPARVPAGTQSSTSFEEERRAVQAMAASLRLPATDDIVTNGFADEDAWLDDLERRLEALPVGRGRSVTERSQFGGPAVDSKPSEPAMR
jgi:hypothetical protein